MNLLLIDTSNLCFRYFFAMPPLYSARSKMQTHVICGWLNFLLGQYQRIPGVPDDVQPIAFFDGGHDGNNSTDLVAGYKGNRAERPEFLDAQMLLVKVVTKLMGVPYVHRKGFEADHLLGAFVMDRLADPDNQDKMFIFSSDKDMLQLVDGERVFQVRVRANGMYKKYGPKEVQEDYGVPPAMIPSLLCLMGDKSDNIPNVPGVGEVTARKLLSEYGSIEAILANLDRLKPKIKAAFEASRDQLPKTMQLVSFSREFQYDVKTSNPEPERLIELCMELDIQKLLARIYSYFSLGG